MCILRLNPSKHSSHLICVAPKRRKELIFLARGDHPNSRKKPPRIQGQMKFLVRVPTNSGNRSGSCSENCGFHIAQVVRRHSESGISYSENYFLNSESCSENTPELSQGSENGLSLRECFSRNWGVSQACEFWTKKVRGFRAKTPSGQMVEMKQKGVFVKGRFWANVPSFRNFRVQEYQNH